MGNICFVSYSLSDMCLCVFCSDGVFPTHCFILFAKILNWFAEKNTHREKERGTD